MHIGVTATCLRNVVRPHGNKRFPQHSLVTDTGVARDVYKANDTDAVPHPHLASWHQRESASSVPIFTPPRLHLRNQLNAHECVMETPTGYCALRIPGHQLDALINLRPTFRLFASQRIARMGTSISHSQSLSPPLSLSDSLSSCDARIFTTAHTD